MLDAIKPVQRRFSKYAFVIFFILFVGGGCVVDFDLACEQELPDAASPGDADTDPDAGTGKTCQPR
ncbi:MAG: hypothetical protein QNJ97_01015 [Myxococcota bacterium]|nr:hypothetical protein [Myxococcota bacterium]